MKYQIEPDESVSDAVLKAARLFEECESTTDEQLYKVVDPDALNTLFAPVDSGTPRQGGQVSFIYGSCHFVLENGEHLIVTPIESEEILGRDHWN
jgi:hypothetical protein